jgi:phosphoribosylformimino-5-aminoimidazole carboxamide ribotide isomerase
VADLDGILDQRPNLDMLREICDSGVDVMLDAGVVGMADIDLLRQRLNCRIVVASETFRQIDELIAGGIVQDLVFSVDLKSGVLQTADAGYLEADPEVLVGKLAAAGLSDVIVLDIAAVGTGRGVPTLDLCRLLRTGNPELRLITGGGVHSCGCIEAARDAGIDGLLIASAIHDGRFSSCEEQEMR